MILFGVEPKNCIIPSINKRKSCKKLIIPSVISGVPPSNPGSAPAGDYDSNTIIPAVSAAVRRLQIRSKSGGPVIVRLWPWTCETVSIRSTFPVKPNRTDSLRLKCSFKTGPRPQFRCCLLIIKILSTPQSHQDGFHFKVSNLIEQLTW